MSNTTTIFYQETEIVVNCIRNRFQQKDLIEALQTIEILLLKALREENFGHELSNDLHKFKLETQLKTLTHIVDEKQAEIKHTITIISSFNASQKLLVSEVLKLVKLTLTVPATNAVSERSCSMLRKFKTYLRSTCLKNF